VREGAAGVNLHIGESVGLEPRRRDGHGVGADLELLEGETAFAAGLDGLLFASLIIFRRQGRAGDVAVRPGDRAGNTALTALGESGGAK
jgi:hypothetical protein